MIKLIKFIVEIIMEIELVQIHRYDKKKVVYNGKIN